MTSKQKKITKEDSNDEDDNTNESVDSSEKQSQGNTMTLQQMQYYHQVMAMYSNAMNGIPVPTMNPQFQDASNQNIAPPSNFFFPFSPNGMPNIPIPTQMIPMVPKVPKKKSQDPPTNPQLRVWKTEFPNEAIKQDIDGDNISVSITMKIRGEEAAQYVPERLYSSHKYVVQHEVAGDHLVSKYPLIVAKLQVIDPVSRQKIINSQKGKKEDVVKGTPEAALTHEGASSANAVTGVMKIQFTDVSYRHEKGHFAMHISYYNPANLDEPLFNIISPAFKVFARKPTDQTPTETLKPNKIKPTTRKRKSENDVQTVINNTPPQIPYYVTNPTQSQDSEPEPITSPSPSIIEQAQKKMKLSPIFTEFSKKLEQLALMKERLNENDKKMAHEFSMEKLLAIDPEFTMDFFLKSDNGGNVSGNNTMAPMFQGMVQNVGQVNGNGSASASSSSIASSSQDTSNNSAEFLNSDNFDST